MSNQNFFCGIDSDLLHTAVGGNGKKPKRAPYQDLGDAISHAVGTTFGGMIGQRVCGEACALAGGSLGYDTVDKMPKTGNGHSDAAERGANARFGRVHRR